MKFMQFKMPVLFTFTAKNNDYVHLVQNDIIHDELNSLILTFSCFKFHVER